MIVVTEPAALTAPAPHKRRALVPTMGALHQGHLALVQTAREAVGPEGDVVVSIFVNPIQFDKATDLKSYPRPLEDDLAQCEAAGVDLVFCPEAAALYHPDRSVTVTETLLSQHLCGATRPGHFDGVCTVVLKLFNLCRPDIAIFGKKDFQQLAIIRRMVRDLDVPVEIMGHATVREPDGVAKSSRNQRLTVAQRQDAPRLSRALIAAKSLRPTGVLEASRYLQTARFHLEKEAPSDFSIDYLEIVDAETLQPLRKVDRPCILATACFYGSVRLIDHIELIATHP